MPRREAITLGLLVPLLSSLASLAVPLSYLIVARVQLNVSELMAVPEIELPKLFVLCGATYFLWKAAGGLGLL